MAKTDARMTRILVQLPAPLKSELDCLKREGYSAAGYLRHLLQEDLRARKEAGWVPGAGWSEDIAAGAEKTLRFLRKQMGSRRRTKTS